ncbi:MAG: NADH-quinone oxidoreductase subunit G [Actinomycetota bacterium]|nr:NADH-quinone oxidoreductase subunit G [Actinomycetota bacterium]
MTASEVEAVDTVTLTIDGVEVTVPKGTLVIRAAETIGVQIPRFCDHPLLEPVGACRQCLVEVEMGGRKMPKPQAACTIEVADGMVVNSQLTSAVADKAQQGNMELLLINHPLDCPVCDKGGECPLQNQAMSHGRAESRFIDAKRTYPKPLAISSQVLLDRERCVLCARCTRFSLQIAGDPFIELFERGALEQVAIYEDEPFSSYFSGNTIQICPVGALTSAAYRFRSRPFDLVSEPSVCEHCASGCAQRTDIRRNVVQRRLAGDDPPVNEEWNCDKGRFAFRYATSNNRIMKPLIRRGAELVEASWTDALEFAAQGLAAAMTDGGGGVGVLPGGRLTVEDAYAYAKFARVVLHTNDIDFRARAHSVEEEEFLAERVAGTDPAAGGVTYADLSAASAVLTVGFEPEEESPIIFLRLRKAAREARLAVYDIAAFATTGLTKLNGVVIATPPGAEASVMGALADNTAGGPGARAAHALRQPGAVLLVGERLAEFPGALSAAAALADATGAKLGWVPRRAGERGAIEAGTLPSLLPGGRRIGNATDRVELGKAWRTDVPANPGRDLNSILTATRDGELGALLVGGVDPDDLPDPVLAREALAATGFLVSLELASSVVTEYAHVVFPVAAAPEKSGSYLNWEGRRRPFRASLSSGMLPDGRVLHGLADEFDIDLGLPTPESAAAELARIAQRRPGSDPALLTTKATPLPALRPGEAILASWRHLLDVGSLQVDEPALAGTARSAAVRMPKSLATELGIAEADLVRVTGERGSVILPAHVTDMPDQVVWLPMRSAGCAVRTDLGTAPGGVVTVAREES